MNRRLKKVYVQAMSAVVRFTNDRRGDHNVSGLGWMVIAIVIIAALLLVVKTAFPSLITDILNSARTKFGL